jgi:hypothetical protein
MADVDIDAIERIIREEEEKLVSFRSLKLIFFIYTSSQFLFRGEAHPLSLGRNANIRLLDLLLLTVETVLEARVRR